MVSLTHGINGHEFEQTLGDSEGQGNLDLYSPWGPKESDTTWQLNNSSSSRTNTFSNKNQDSHPCLIDYKKHAIFTQDLEWNKERW